MDNGVKLVELKAQDALIIRTRLKLENLPQAIGEGYGRIMGYMAGLGEAMVGVPYTAYHNMDMQDLDVEIGIPVARKLPSIGDIKSGYGVSGLCIEAMYIGPYSAMIATYNYLAEWMESHGYEPSGPYYEYYYNSPQEVPESELMTKIIIPVRKKG